MDRVAFNRYLIRKVHGEINETYKLRGMPSEIMNRFITPRWGEYSHYEIECLIEHYQAFIDDMLNQNNHNKETLIIIDCIAQIMIILSASLNMRFFELEESK